MSRWSDRDIEALWGNVGRFEAGEPIGADYEIVQLLGKGGQAEVYEVKNNKDGRTYVAKIFFGDEESRSFEHEQKIFVALEGTETNPHLIHSHPATGTGEQKVLILDCLEGPALQEYLETEGPSIALAKRVVGDVLAGLAAMHARGVVHRDVKPSNIKLVDGGKRAVLFDFSIASKVRDSDAPYAKTPGYAPPEKEATQAWDIFSAGVLLHEVATGRRPLWESGGQRPKAPRDRLVMPREFRLHPALSGCLEKSLAYEQESRFQSVKAFARAFSLWTCPVMTARAASKWVVRHRFWAATLLLSVVLLWGVSRSVLLVERQRFERLLQAKDDEISIGDKRIDDLQKELYGLWPVAVARKRKDLEDALEKYSLNLQAGLRVCDEHMEKVAELHLPDEEKEKLRSVIKESRQAIERTRTFAEHRAGLTVLVTSIDCTVAGEVPEQLWCLLSIEKASPDKHLFKLTREEKSARLEASDVPVSFAHWNYDANVEVVLLRKKRWIRRPRPEDQLVWARKDLLHVLQPEPSANITWPRYTLRIEGKIATE